MRLCIMLFLFILSTCLAQTISEQKFVEFMKNSERTKPSLTTHQIKGRLPAHVAILIETFKGGLYEKWQNDSAVELVFCANLATDLATIKEDWGLVSDAIAYFYTARDFSRIYNHSRSLVAPVQRLTKSSKFKHGGGGGDYLYGAFCFHFDDLFTFNEITNRWQEFEIWAREETKKTQKSMDYWQNQGGREDFLIILGIVSHAVQDFYCHSSYAKQLRKMYPTYAATALPIWDELMHEELGQEVVNRDQIITAFMGSNRTVTSEKEYTKNEIAGLQTGDWGFNKKLYDSEQKESQYPWKHRDDTQPMVMEFAARATNLWREKMIGWLAPEYRNDLRQYLGLPQKQDKKL